VVGLALAVLGAPWPCRALAIGGIAAHAILRRPGPTPRVLFRSDGFADLPDDGLVDFEVGPRSSYTSWWVSLQLRGPGRVVHVVLLADQLDDETWRALQAELRRHPSSVTPVARRSRRDGDPRGDLR
jgi:hypothetical protein